MPNPRHLTKLNASLASHMVNPEANNLGPIYRSMLLTLAEADEADWSLLAAAITTRLGGVEAEPLAALACAIDQERRRRIGLVRQKAASNTG